MKRHSFSVLFFINKKKLRKNGEAPILIRVRVDGISVESQIKRSVPPDMWDQNMQSSRGRDKSAREINEYINKLKGRIHEIHSELELRSSHFTARLIMDKLYGVDDKVTVLGYFRKHNEHIRSLIDIDYALITVRRYDNCCRYLGELIKKELGKEDISFNELNGDLVRSYERYLKITKGCQQNTVIRYMKCFKKIINMAIADEIISKNPFAGIKFTPVEVVKEVLTIEELSALQNKEFFLQRLEYVRDVFIFCCFSGLAYIDVNNLRAEHITRDNNGDYWIMKTREKTNVMCNVPLLPIPIQILKKYGYELGHHKKGPLLPVTSNQKMNSYLKEIAALCGITKNLTTHTARYTYATVVCLANGVAIQNVSRMLGHTDIRMTLHYAKVMNTSIKKDMEQVRDFFGKNTASANG